MNYSFSTSYDKEKGYLKGNDNQRVMLNLTTSAKLTKNLTFDVSLNTVLQKRKITVQVFQNLKHISVPGHVW